MAAGTVDPEVHRRAVAMYETLETLIPNGESRVEMSLSELARESMVFGDTPTEREVKQVWAYLRRLECVDNERPRYKMALQHPDTVVGGSDGDIPGAGDPTDDTGVETVADEAVAHDGETGDDAEHEGIAEDVADEEGTEAQVGDEPEEVIEVEHRVELKVDPNSLVAQATAFSEGLEASLDDLSKLRDHIEALVQDLAVAQREHNGLVDALYDMRDQLADTGLGEFVDQVLGDELWHYEDA